MAHFAILDENNIVIQVVVGRDEDENAEDELTAKLGQTYKRTSYNTLNGQHLNGKTPFRKHFAGIGYKYDEAKDAFIPPQKYPSWTFNETTWNWECPVAHPGDSSNYRWNEDTQKWDVYPAPE